MCGLKRPPKTPHKRQNTEGTKGMTRDHNFRMGDDDMRKI